MAAGGQGGDVVLGTVHHTGLQCWVDLTPGHRCGGCAQRLDHFDGGGALLHTDLHALEVVGRGDGLLGVEAACARVIKGQADKTTALAGCEDGVAHRAVHHLEEMALVTEHEGQVEHLVFGRKSFQRGGAGLGHFQHAVLHLLQRFALAAQGAVGKNLDFEFTVGLLFGQLGELHHGQVHRVVFGQTVG